MDNSTRKFELLSSLQWYFESKNFSLKKALSIRCPLSVEKQTELRQYYSRYFSDLVSAIDMLRENDAEFQEIFEKRFTFDGFPEGKTNHSYIRELRNGIIHRGLDISSAAHIKDDFPLLIAPESVRDKSGRNSYSSFGYYLLEVISKCENTVGPLIREYLEEKGLLIPSVDQKEAAAKSDLPGHFGSKLIEVN